MTVFSGSAKSIFGKAECIAASSIVKSLQFVSTSTIMNELVSRSHARLSVRSRVSSNLRLELDCAKSRRSECSLSKCFDSRPGVLKGFGLNGHIDFTSWKFIVVNVFLFHGSSCWHVS